MARLQQTQRKRVGSVPRLPVDVVAAIAAEDYGALKPDCIMVHENQTVSIVVNCSIRGRQVKFSEDDVNVALGIPTENLVEVSTPDELADFMNFINNSERINLSSLNKKFFRRECSFLFDSIVRAFTCRKTGYDNISSVVQKLVFSMAHNKHLKFVMPALNHKVHDIHMLNGIDRTKIGNFKQVSKVLFGSLINKNKVPGPSQADTLPSIPLEARKPTTSSSQKAEVSKKKRKHATFKVVTESGDDNTELESHLVGKPKKAKKNELATEVTSAPSQHDAVEADRDAKFIEDVWSRMGGGGAVWEKAGVKVSVVYSIMPPKAYRAATSANANVKPAPVPSFAAGISSVCLFPILPPFLYYSDD
ncbi:hypothetical protein AgCh_037919 [Apium graveolens]